MASDQYIWFDSSDVKSKYDQFFRNRVADTDADLASSHQYTSSTTTVMIGIYMFSQTRKTIENSRL